MEKTAIIKARCSPALKEAVAQLAGEQRRESATLRALVCEGLRRRGLWPPGDSGRPMEEAKRCNAPV